MKIVNSRSADGNLQDGSISHHCRDPDVDGLLPFNHRLAPAITTWKEPVSSGTIAERARMKRRYTDRCKSALRSFVCRKNNFQIQVLYAFGLGYSYAGKIPQEAVKHFIKRWINCFETSQDRHWFGHKRFRLRLLTLTDNNRFYF